MARTPNTNYSSSPFVRATSDLDLFDRDDLNLLATAVDLHDHADTRGLPVARTGTNSVATTAVQDNAITDGKIGNRTVVPATVPTGNGPDTLTNLLSQLSNRIKTGFGTTNWYDTPAVALTGKVSKVGDTMTGALAITRNGGTPDATLYAFSTLVLNNGSAADPYFPSIGFTNQGEMGVALYAFNEQLTNGYTFRAIDSAGVVARFATDKNGGPGSGFNSDMVDGLHAGASSGQIPINGGGIMTNLYANFARQVELGISGTMLSVGTGSGQVPYNNGVVNTNLNADMVDGVHAGGANGQIPINGGGLMTNLWATFASQLWDGATMRTPGNGNGNIPINNGIVNTNLNADLLDNLSSASFLRSDAANASASITALTVSSISVSAINASGDVLAGSHSVSAGEFISSSGGDELGFYTQNTVRGHVADTGDLIWNTPMKAPAFTVVSDKRLKRDIRPIAFDALAILRQLRPVTYEFERQRNVNQKIQAGFIAQDLLEVFPIAVSKDITSKMYGIDSMALIALLAKNAQEQDARIQRLEMR